MGKKIFYKVLILLSIFSGMTDPHASILDDSDPISDTQAVSVAPAKKTAPTKLFWLDSYSGQKLEGFLIIEKQNRDISATTEFEFSKADAKSCNLEISKAEKDSISRWFRTFTFEIVRNPAPSEPRMTRRLMGPTRPFFPFSESTGPKNVLLKAPSVVSSKGEKFQVFRYSVNVGEGSFIIFNLLENGGIHSLDWIQSSEDTFNKDGFQMRCQLNEVTPPTQNIFETPQT